MSLRPLGTALLLASLAACLVGSAHASGVLVGRDGSARISREGDLIATLTPAFALDGWQFRSFSVDRGADADVPARSGVADLGGGRQVRVLARFEPTPTGLHVTYTMHPTANLTVNTRHASLSLPLRLWAGARWTAGDAAGTIPAERGPTHIYSGTPEALRLVAPDGAVLAVSCPSGHAILLQDSREWGGDLDIRVGPQAVPATTWPAGEELVIEVSLGFEEPTTVEFDEPVTLAPSDLWIEMPGTMEIAPGSALDWSDQGLCDAPAGKYGRLVVAESGHFEFADRPGQPARFYGVNLCFSALVLEHAEADALAVRLRMLGYNAVRIHHYESGVIDQGAADSLTPHAGNLDKLDYLVAALKRNGIYVTTDVYVSRPVRASEVFPGAEGQIAMDSFKTLVLVNDRAFENWCAFARLFLGHVNPYTGMALAEDPALAGLVCINEGNAGNFVEGLDDVTRPDWQRRLNEWLLDRYGDRAKLAEVWGGDLGLDEDPAAGTVELRRGGGRRAVDFAVFWAEFERDAFARMSAFLREELGVRTPITDMNGWTESAATQAVRDTYDFVDSHRYWDHPSFLERPWSLPTRGWSGGGSATASDGAGARDQALVRVLGKPFTISELNFAGPNRYRAESGLLMGAVAAIQDWDGLYRFAYSHARGNLFTPRPTGFFDLATDPAMLASDRAGILLFLRGDLEAATSTVGAVVDPGLALDAPDRMTAPDGPLTRLAWVSKVGTSFSNQGVDPDVAFDGLVRAGAPGLLGSAFTEDALSSAVSALRESGALSRANRTNVAEHLYESQTGQVLLDGRAGTIAIAGDRGAAVFSARPGVEVGAGPLYVAFEEYGGAVWVASLDGQPLETSERLLVAHITDVQNTGQRFAEREMLTLEDWGHPPYLVRKGTAQGALVRQGAALTGWSLALDGKRTEPLPLLAGGGTVQFTADTRGPNGGRIYYELATE